MGLGKSGALLAAVLCLGTAVGAVASGPASDLGGAAAVGSVPPTAAMQAGNPQFTPDTVVLDVKVYENGSAEWEVVYRTRLDDAETAAAFRSYKADIENNSRRYSSQFVERMNSTIRSAEASTDREMRGTNFTVRAEVREFPQRYGVVAYSFEWHGFADVSGDRIRVGDALSGLILNDKTRLLVEWPDGYETTTIRPRPETGFEERERAVVWNGPIEFSSDEPDIVLAAPGAGGPEIPWLFVAAAVGVVAVLGAIVGGAWYVYDREETDDEAAERPPEALLSNEERVLRLLERRGGRVKQKAVVDELGWTEAKTSQVVGELREKGKIESFRLGRENVLALPQERQES